MIKSELIAKLAEENPHLTQRDIERVVGVILERMIEALEDGGRVELRGFGTFSNRPMNTLEIASAKVAAMAAAARALRGRSSVK